MYDQVNVCPAAEVHKKNSEFCGPCDPNMTDMCLRNWSLPSYIGTFLQDCSDLGYVIPRNAALDTTNMGSLETIPNFQWEVPPSENQDYLRGSYDDSSMGPGEGLPSLGQTPPRGFEGPVNYPINHSRDREIRGFQDLTVDRYPCRKGFIGSPRMVPFGGCGLTPGMHVYDSAGMTQQLDVQDEGVKDQDGLYPFPILDYVLESQGVAIRGSQVQRQPQDIQKPSDKPEYPYGGVGPQNDMVRPALANEIARVDLLAQAKKSLQSSPARTARRSNRRERAPPVLPVRTRGAELSENGDGPRDVYHAEYCKIPVLEMIFNNTTVMRRKVDGYLNATQILKAAGVEKGRRIRILDREIVMGKHEKVQGGCGKYQGTWVPFEKGIQLAAVYGIETDLKPLFEIQTTDPSIKTYKKISFEKAPVRSSMQKTAAARLAGRSTPNRK